MPSTSPRRASLSETTVFRRTGRHGHAGHRKLHPLGQPRHCDQDYLDYIVFNDSSVPDRTAYILGESDENPFPVLADDIEKATAMGASFIVLTCNTAHYFYDDFQALTTVPILHMPRGAVARMAQRYPKDRFPRVGFLGTVGSRKSGVYKRAVEEAGYTFVEPSCRPVSLR